MLFQVQQRGSDFFEKCMDIKKALQKASPNHRQLMLSATFNESMSETMMFLRENFLFLQIGEHNQAVPTVTQQFIPLGKYEKQDKLKELLIGRSSEEWVGDCEWFYSLCLFNKYPIQPNPFPLSVRRYIPSRTIVFVKYKRQSDRIAIFLAQSGFNVISINADRTLKQRVDAVANFTRNVYQVGIREWKRKIENA